MSAEDTDTDFTVVDLEEAFDMELRKPSVAKSLYAQSRPRVGGKFVKVHADPEDSESQPTKLSKQPKRRGRPPKNPTISKDDLLYDTRVIPESVRDYIGSDSRKFFEMALVASRTWSEGYKYAKELKPLQHPSLSAQQIKQEVEVTKKILTWAWEDSQNQPLILEGDVNDNPKDSDSISADAFTSEYSQEYEEI